MIPNFFDYKAYLFDFDGLLADTETVHFSAYKKMLSTHGFELPWDFKTYCLYAHQSTEVLSKAIYDLFPKLKQKQPNWEILRQEKIKIYSRLLEEETTQFMPGALELLSTLKVLQKPLCIVTNSPKDHIQTIFKPFPEALQMFDGVLTREDYTRPKPSPDGYLAALSFLGIEAKDSIGFEDTPKGIQALQKAKITPVLIRPNDYPLPPTDLLEQTYCLSSLSDVL